MLSQLTVNLVFNTALQWSNAADDAAVLAAGRNTVNRATAEAKAKGLSFKWIYQNVSRSPFLRVRTSLTSVSHSMLHKSRKCLKAMVPPIMPS